MVKLVLSALLIWPVAQSAHIVYQQNIPASLVALDPRGNVFVTGSSTVTKLTPQGDIVFTKQLGSLGDWAAIAAGPSGELVIAGTTTSDSLPTTAGVLQPKRNSNGACVSGDMSAQPIPCPDAFLAKLDAAGNLVWVTYLGGSQQDQAFAVAVDRSGDIYVAGLTQSSDFYNASAFQPALGGYADAFVTKVSADGASIRYSSFLGGSGYDLARAIAVDASGNAFVGGQIQGQGLTSSGGFGQTCGASGTSAFLIKIAPSGNRLVFGGCLTGAHGYSETTALSLDGQGDVYAGGTTNPQSLQPTPGAFTSLLGTSSLDFIAKIQADGSNIVYTSLFDGGSFGVSSIAVDAAGAVYAAASTTSPSLPSLGPTMQPCPGPEALIYNVLVKLNSAGSSATYFSYDDASGQLAAAADGSLYEASGKLRKIAALDSPGDSFLSSLCVLNGASFKSHLEYGQPGISPGEIVTLEGTRLGPSAAPPVAYGLPPQTSLAGVQVFFDGVAAPLLYVQDRQVNVIAPYELAGKTQTSIQVQFNDKKTVPVPIKVSVVSAAVFEDASGQPIVFNQDFTVNGANTPASRGSALVLFITGGGQTSPPSVDGEISQTLGGLQASVSAELQHIGGGIGNVTAPVLYAGPAPGEVTGVQQLNLLIPANLPLAFDSPGGPAGHSFLNVTIGSQTISVPFGLR